MSTRVCSGSFWRLLVGMALVALFAVPMLPFRRSSRAEDYAWIPGKLSDYHNPNFQEAVQAISPDYDQLHRDEQIEAYLRAYRQLNAGQTPNLSPYDAFLADGDKYGPDLPPPPFPESGDSAAPPPAQNNRPAGDSDYTFIPGYGYHYTPPGYSDAGPAGGFGASPPVPPRTDSEFNNVPFSTNPFVAKPREVDQLHVTQEHVNQANVTQLHAGPF